jgi:hypothetical protein
LQRDQHAMYPCNESDPVDACVSIIVSIHDAANKHTSREQFTDSLTNSSSFARMCGWGLSHNPRLYASFGPISPQSSLPANSVWFHSSLVLVQLLLQWIFDLFQIAYDDVFVFRSPGV